jgi:hypothetical protein
MARMTDTQHMRLVNALTPVCQELYKELWGTINKHVIRYDISEEELADTLTAIAKYQRSRV